MAFTALFVALRVVHLDADPPNWIGGCFTRELYAEPPAKAHEARNYALFGTWHLNPIDNYQFWRAQSPVWVYPLTGWFVALGTDYPQLRSYSVLYAAAGFALVLLLVARNLGIAALCFVGFALAADRVHLHYTRVGLVEPAVNAWIALTALLLIRAQARPGLLPLAHLAFLLAFFTKQAALFALPVVAGASATVLLRRGGDPRERRERMLGWLNAAVLLAMTAAYMSSDSYRRSVEHNAGHVFLGSDSEEPYQWRGMQSLLFRFTDPERYYHLWVTARLTGGIGLATLGLWLVQLQRGVRLGAFRLVSAGWFACALIAMFVIAKSELRFWTLVVLPAALVAGAGLDQAVRWLASRGRRRLARLLIPGAIALCFAINVRGLERALVRPTFKLRDAAAELRAHLGDEDATIVGMASPQLVLGTPYKNFYVRREFNTTRAALRSLGITHALFYDKGDHTRDMIERELPGSLRGLRPELHVEFRNQGYDLFRIGRRFDRYPE